jgi:hypothetical protein
MSYTLDAISSYAPRVILDSLRLTPSDIHRAIGWEIKPEGACKGDRCVPLRGLATAADGTVDVGVFARSMDMPLVGDDKHGLWSLGPCAGAKVLDSAALPEIRLANFDGDVFDMVSLRDRKVLLVAWASW